MLRLVDQSCKVGRFKLIYKDKGDNGKWSGWRDAEFYQYDTAAADAIALVKQLNTEVLVVQISAQFVPTISATAVHPE